MDIFKLGPIKNPQIIEDRNSTMMPLEYVIIVRADNISSDRFVLGDGQIIIAGYGKYNRTQVLSTCYVAQLLLHVGSTQIFSRNRTDKIGIWRPLLHVVCFHVNSRFH